MKGNQSHTRDSSDVRYEQLSQLIQRYELGSITHQQFERIKQEILLGETVPRSLQSSRIELIVATYSDLDHLQSSVDNLLTLSSSSRHGMIDGVLVLKSSSDAIRLRSIAGLTRPRETGGSPVIVSLCSLLFPLEAIHIDSREPGWKQALDFMACNGVADEDLRRFGDSLGNGSQSIALVYWSSRADEIAAAFHGFDVFARRILGDAVVDALTTLLQ